MKEIIRAASIGRFGRSLEIGHPLDRRLIISRHYFPSSLDFSSPPPLPSRIDTNRREGSKIPGFAESTRCTGQTPRTETTEERHRINLPRTLVIFAVTRKVSNPSFSHRAEMEQVSLQIRFTAKQAGVD